MTAPMKLPIVGMFNKREISKEELLEFWNGVIKKTRLEIKFSERMETITKESGAFVVKTSRGNYKTKNVLLAIGRRGTPRKLGVPGEAHAAVLYVNGTNSAIRQVVAPLVQKVYLVYNNTSEIGRAHV